MTSSMHETEQPMDGSDNRPAYTIRHGKFRDGKGRCITLEINAPFSDTALSGLRDHMQTHGITVRPTAATEDRTVLMVTPGDRGVPSSGEIAVMLHDAFDPFGTTNTTFIPPLL